VPVDSPPTVPGARLGLAPNPFNPRTTLFMRSATTGPATIEAFDLRGQSLGTIWNGWLSPDLAGGAAQADWSGEDSRGQDLASGVYLLRLRDAAGNVATARATLAR
jgi:hypothetical protein